jgi:DNA polymerase-3 subunit alpha
MPAVALTDTANLFGALEFAQAATAKGIQPIMGCQLWLSRAASGEVRDEALRAGADAVVALAMDARALANLRCLSSLGWMHSEDLSGKPALTLEQLCSHAEGLFLLTGGDNGPLSRLLAEGRRDAAAFLLAALREAYPDRLAVELMRHGPTPQQAALEPGLLRLADEAALPIVATNDVYFAEPKTYEAHDALLCIAQGRMVSERDRRRVTPEHFFKPAAAMREAFADLPEACDNTLAIARMCAVMEISKKPELPICPKVQPGRTEAETVADMARTGLAKRFPDGVPPSTPSAGIRAGRHRADGLLRLLPHRRRLHPVGEGPGHRRRAGPRLGRGQRGGLGALHHRPRPAALRLLFERFLNPERVSMPDFDIDFCQERRDEVIAYVRREYGEDRVAQIITFGKLQAKAAVRDVGRVLGMAYGQVDRVASLIPTCRPTRST